MKTPGEYSWFQLHLHEWVKRFKKAFERTCTPKYIVRYPHGLILTLKAFFYNIVQVMSEEYEIGHVLGFT